MLFHSKTVPSERVRTSNGCLLGSARKPSVLLLMGSIALALAVSSCSAPVNTAEIKSVKSSSVAVPTDDVLPSIEQVPEPVVDEPSPTPAPKVVPTTKPAPATVLPKVQADMIASVEAARTAFDAATTDLKRSKIITDRDTAICALTGGEFSGWKGQITKIGSNNDGDAYVTVKIDGDIELATWNNAFSDISDETLIKSGTPLWQKLSEMEEKTQVIIDGSFVADDGTCVKTSNMTETFNAASPDFVVRFSDVRMK